MEFQGMNDVQNGIRRNNRITLQISDYFFEYVSYEAAFHECEVCGAEDKYRRRITEMCLAQQEAQRTSILMLQEILISVN